VVGAKTTSSGVLRRGSTRRQRPSQAVRSPEHAGCLLRCSGQGGPDRSARAAVIVDRQVKRTLRALSLGRERALAEIRMDLVVLRDKAMSNTRRALPAPDILKCAIGGA
jgi:hypothetical protein